MLFYVDAGKLSFQKRLNSCNKQLPIHIRRDILAATGYVVYV